MDAAGDQLHDGSQNGTGRAVLAVRLGRSVCRPDFGAFITQRGHFHQLPVNVIDQIVEQ